jgi:hypothetical protein
MSVHAHFGIEQSRRDDMEAISYLLVYFLKGGKLPWMGLKIDGIRERYKMIGHKKEEISTTKLCAELPREFGTYLRYVKTLKFTDTPDYNYLRNLFRSCLISRKLPEDDVFDWMNLQSLQPSPVSKSSRNSETRDRRNEVFQERYSPAKPQIVIFNSPTKMNNGSNLNRHLSKSVGNIESSAGVTCSPLVSECVSNYEDESQSKVLQITS